YDATGDAKETLAASAGRHLENAFDFMNRTFGKGQEMVLFLTELSNGYHALRFIRANGSDAYYEYSKLLLLKDRAEALREELTH
ncbi:MAG: ATPase, partial [Lachnospiraceae bacterium]|nr:ATPase [Lachnospiraceae bacterium]